MSDNQTFYFPSFVDPSNPGSGYTFLVGNTVILNYTTYLHEYVLSLVQLDPVSSTDDASVPIHTFMGDLNPSWRTYPWDCTTYDFSSDVSKEFNFRISGFEGDDIVPPFDSAFFEIDDLGTGSTATSTSTVAASTTSPSISTTTQAPTSATASITSTTDSASSETATTITTTTSSSPSPADPTSSPSSTLTSDSSTGLSGGATAGVAIGAAVGGGLLVALLFWFLRRKLLQRRRRRAIPSYYSDTTQVELPEPDEKGQVYEMPSPPMGGAGFARQEAHELPG